MPWGPTGSSAKGELYVNDGAQEMGILRQKKNSFYQTVLSPVVSAPVPEGQVAAGSWALSWVATIPSKAPSTPRRVSSHICVLTSHGASPETATCSLRGHADAHIAPG